MASSKFYHMKSAFGRRSRERKSRKIVSYHQYFPTPNKDYCVAQHEVGYLLKAKNNRISVKEIQLEEPMVAEDKELYEEAARELRAIWIHDESFFEETTKLGAIDVQLEMDQDDLEEVFGEISEYAAGSAVFFEEKDTSPFLKTEEEPCEHSAQFKESKADNTIFATEVVESGKVQLEIAPDDCFMMALELQTIILVVWLVCIALRKR